MNPCGHLAVTKCLISQQGDLTLLMPMTR